ncbi:MAG: uroporphyrinogen-III C-methyltransferase [Prolixibacteraceae bacterium]
MNHLISITGAGPGDPGLLTVKAKERIVNAEVLIYDALPGDAILKLAPKDALFIYAGKLANDGQNQQIRQEAINLTLLEMARKGKQVVRLKGGDPMIFGRGAEEIRFCQQQALNYEVIPGISAAMAASSEFGIPLTERNKSSMVLLYTGSRTNGQFDNLKSVLEVLKSGSTVSLYMGFSKLADFVETLINSGIPTETHVNILSNVSQAERESLCGNLLNIRYLIEQAQPKTPAIILIGKYAEQICNENKNQKPVELSSLLNIKIHQQEKFPDAG